MMRRNWPPCRSGGILFEALESRQLLSATPQLLADINTQQSGNPSELIEFQGRLYFVASDDVYGSEIWSTDGTEAGTQLLADLAPGASSSSFYNFVVSGDYLFFVMRTSDAGTELWRTDGTDGGTQLVRDIAPGSSSGLWSSAEMVDVAGTLFFVADDGTDEGLWKSDGTEAGTTLVKVVSSNAFSISDLTAVGDTLFFLGSDQVHGKELWKSDGTPVGTVLVKDIEPGSSGSWGSDLIAFGGELYFEASEDIFDTFFWKSDGTVAGTQKVQLPGELNPEYLSNYVVSGDWLYFTGTTSATGYELWRTDGTLEGTTLVADLTPGTSSSSLSNFFDVDGTLYFIRSVNGAWQLYKTGGAAPGATWLASLEKNGQSPYLSDIASYAGNLYFTATSSVFGTDLWRSDGTPLGTYPLHAGIMPAGSRSDLVVAAGQLFFTANIAGTGRELWRTAGDYSSTRIVKDFTDARNDSSSPRNFVTAGDFVYFTANDGHGEQLWVSSGTAGNAVRLTHSAYGLQSSLVEQLTPAGDLLYFVASDILGRRYLGVSDGTPEGTHSLAWPAGISNPQVHGLTAFGDGVIFTIRDAQQGFAVLKASGQQVDFVQTLGPAWNLPPLYYGTESHIDPVVWQGNYYFVAGDSSGAEIWRTDGTAAGTIALRSLVPNIGHYAASLTVTDSALYFLAGQSYPQSPAGLWRTDGTPEGTWHMSGVAARKLIGVGDKLFFTTPTTTWPPTYTLSLGVTDGTPAGTLTLGTIFDEHNLPGSPHLKAVAYDGQLYFFGTANDLPGYSPAALWKSDGTPAGTSRVAQTAFGLPQYVDIAVVGGQILIGDVPYLYSSDGTADGTKLLSDGFFNIRFYLLKDSIAALNGNFYFSGSDPTASLEPFYLQYQVPSTVVGRHLFYNQSKFDGNGAGLGDSDDNAIAPDKTPYLAGSGIATFDNISSYSRGINGVMIDIAGLPPAPNPAILTLDDFVFRVGTSNDLGTWTTAPAPLEISFRYPTTSPDITRVSLRWANNAIANTWLEVTVLANERTGLAEPDVFYFGSRIGDTGISSPPMVATTGISDALAVRNRPGVNVSLTNPFDFDRNQLVNIGDELVARNNAGILLKLNLPLPSVSAPVAGPLSAVPLSAVPLSAVPLVAAPAEDVFVDTIAAVELELLGDVPEFGSRSTSAPPRGELLAYAMQRWNEWLAKDEDEELIAGLFGAATARR